MHSVSERGNLGVHSGYGTTSLSMLAHVGQQRLYMDNPHERQAWSQFTKTRKIQHLYQSSPTCGKTTTPSRP